MLNFLYISIWLLTCGPGEDLYARYGHTAIRVQDIEAGYDLCFNYGTFDFDTEFFYWKFVRGETYYMLGVDQSSDFYRWYTQSGRKIYEQELNLNDEQKERLVEALRVNMQPENREYLYNFVYDNCATRPLALLQTTLGDSLYSDYQGSEGQSYRHYISQYTRPYSVIDGLINLVFGYRADEPMRGQERLFLPEELMNYVAHARLKDGTPLVKQQHIGKFEVQPTPWWGNYLFYLALFALLMTLLSVYDRHRGQRTKVVDYVLYGVYGLLFLLVTFLTFFSIHPLVGYDIRLLIIPAIHLCTRLIYLLR